VIWCGEWCPLPTGSGVRGGGCAVPGSKNYINYGMVRLAVSGAKLWNSSLAIYSKTRLQFMAVLGEFHYGVFSRIVMSSLGKCRCKTRLCPGASRLLLVGIRHARRLCGGRRRIELSARSLAGNHCNIICRLQQTPGA